MDCFFYCGRLWALENGTLDDVGTCKTGKQSQFETWKTGSDWLKLVLKIRWTQDVARCCKSLSCRKWSAGCLCKRLLHHLPTTFAQTLLMKSQQSLVILYVCVYIYICIMCVPLKYSDLQLMFAVTIAIHKSLFYIPENIGVLPTAGGFGFPSHSNQNKCELIGHFHSFISSLSCVSPCVCKVFIYGSLLNSYIHKPYLKPNASNSPNRQLNQGFQ